MNQYGLIGYPLTHSFSKKYFEEKFRRENITGCRYDLFPLASIEELPGLLKAYPELRGINVTIPFKESVMKFLDKTDEAARQIGAVNCLHILNGKLFGYNTDAIGFECSLRNFSNPFPVQAFVLGTGGSSKAVVYVLNKLKIPYLIVSRNRQRHVITYPEIEKHLKDSNLFINCTPSGMYPEIHHAPAIPYPSLTPKDYLFDLVYNPEETLFLKRGKDKGAAVKNGMEMLRIQAEESWNIWNR